MNPTHRKAIAAAGLTAVAIFGAFRLFEWKSTETASSSSPASSSVEAKR